MSRSGRWALGGALVSLALALALIDPYLFTGGDNAAYYALTRALATGRGYVDLIGPGTPPETVYPPGFPLLLVPFYWLGDGSLLVLKLESLVAGAVVLYATWKLAREARGMPEWVAPAAVWLVGLAPMFRTYTSYVLSDMSYTAATTLALVFFQRARTAHEGMDDEGETSRPRLGRWWVAGTLVSVLAFAVRTAGVALFGAALLTAVIRRRWGRAALVGAAIALAVVPWLAWTGQRPPETGGYLEQVRASDRHDPESPPLSLGEYPVRALENLMVYAFRDLPGLFWAETPPPLAVTVFGAIVGITLLVIGAVVLARRRGLALYDLFVLLSVAILLVWPWTGDRFLLPLIPILWIVMLAGLDVVSRFLTGGPRVAGWVVAVLIAVLAVGAALQVPGQWRETRSYLDGEELAGYEPYFQDYFEASRWIGDNAPEAVITARKPTLTWYWSGGRPSVVYPFHGDPDRTWEFFRQKGVTHIVVDQVTSDFLAPALEPHWDLIEIAHASPRRAIFVLRIAPGN
ncbi:MAG: ArnT family glycosyltransferase [Gemmatimonadota bacterium]